MNAVQFSQAARQPYMDIAIIRYTRIKFVFSFAIAPSVSAAMA